MGRIKFAMIQGTAPKKPKTHDVYQEQKVHIEDLVIEESIESYERDLKKFLSKYGHVLDIKILQNRELTRG